MKRILSVQDLAAVGRSSMAVTAPVLAAMGHQCCPLPTALLSTHTGGFSPVEKLDATDFFAGALEAYRVQEIDFDCVITGYLSSPQQAQLAARALQGSAAGLKVTDPAMADHGKLYGGFGAQMIEAMADLCAQADLITPNPTEAALLLGRQPFGPLSGDEAEELCAALAQRYDAAVVITGLPLAGGPIVCQGAEHGGKRKFRVSCSYVNASYPGTGDLFCAVLAGALLRGNALQSAAELAARFTESAARATFAAGADPRFGVQFEPLLASLVPKGEER